MGDEQTLLTGNLSEKKRKIMRKNKCNAIRNPRESMRNKETLRAMENK